MTAEIFIWYKNAAEIFEQFELYNNRQSMEGQTNNAIREAFINSWILVKKRKRIKDWIILYGNHYKMVKIFIAWLKSEKMFHDSSNRKFNCAFLFRISVNNICPLQEIDQYCHFVFGNRHLEAYWNPKGMVCCLVNIKTSF
jgi:hypothetical protein